MAAGLHVPVIPLSDVAGSAGAVEFWQIEVGIAVKVGVTLVTMVMLSETETAH